MNDTSSKLTIEEANRIAGGRATVSVDPVDDALWRIEDDDGAAETHEPMSGPQWRDFLAAWCDEEDEIERIDRMQRELEDDQDVGADATSEVAIETMLYELLQDEEMAPEVRRVQTFEDAGVLTTNRGVVIDTHDGHQHQLSIVQSR